MGTRASTPINAFAAARAAILLCSAAMLPFAGCAWWTGEFSVDEVIKTPGRSVDKLGLKETFNPVDLSIYKFDGESSLAYARAAVDKTARNRLQAHVMRISDRICENHKAAIVADQAGINLLADVANLGVSAAGAVVTGGTSRLMSAVSAAIVGTRASFNENLYQKFIAPAITKRIDIDRQEIKLDIDGKRASPHDLYTVDDALYDAQRYHLKCSFYSGLSSLAAEGQKTADERASIEAIIKIDNARVAALDGEMAQLRDQRTKAATAADRAAIDAAIESKNRLKKFLLGRIDVLTKASLGR